MRNSRNPLALRTAFPRFCRQAALTTAALSAMTAASLAAKLPDCKEYRTEDRILCYIDYIRSLPEKDCDCPKAAPASDAGKAPPKPPPTKAIEPGVYTIVRQVEGKFPEGSLSPGTQHLLIFGADGVLDFAGVKFRCNEARTFCWEFKILAVCKRKGSWIKSLPDEKPRLRVRYRCNKSYALVEYQLENN